MSTPETTGAALEDAPRTMFQSPKLADFLAASFEKADLDYEDLGTESFTFTPVT